MPSAPVAERLVSARWDVKRACDLLIAPTPQALLSCQDALECALSALAEFRSQCRENAPDSGAKIMVRALRAEVLRASKLLQHLACFYRGWEKLLGTMSGGYVAGGRPARVARTGRICCRG